MMISNNIPVPGTFRWHDADAALAAFTEEHGRPPTTDEARELAAAAGMTPTTS